MNIVTELPPHLPDNTYVALDSEWQYMNSKQLHRPTSGKFAALTLCYKPDTVHIIFDPLDVTKALEAINNCVWLIHNAKFDITQLRRLANIPPRTKLIDTMLMERILWNGYYSGFGLDDLSRRYLGEFLNKELQKSFDCDSLSDAQIEYAAKDAVTLLRIWNEQRKHITKTDFTIWKEIDLPALWAVMDFQGFRLNKEGWEQLAKKNKERQLEVDAKLSINPRSPKQVVEFLKKNGFPRIESSGEEELEKFGKKYPNTLAAEVSQLILESRCYGKRASTYGMKFIEDYLEHENDYHIIACDYNVNGAETGRFSSSSPNTQNIPITDTKEFREQFIARPGNVLVIGDYSAQEFGIAAWVSKDDKMLTLFNESKDVYISMAKEMYNKTITKGDPMRKRMKSTILGVDYGMSASGLAQREEISIEDAEEIIAQFRRTFPKMARYMAHQIEQKKVVYTSSGRKIWLNPYSNQCPRNALNGPIQGSASDMLKKALGAMHKEWNFDYPFAVVEVTHDEIGCDVPEKIAPKVAEFMGEIMVRVANDMMPGAKFRATPSIVNSWAEKD